jgi:hypothetical protein
LGTGSCPVPVVFAEGEKEHFVKIDSYSFGRIIIDGVLFTSDVIIYPDHVDSSWWRKEGHYLQTVDLSDALSVMPDILIIGTGNLGEMAVPKDTVAFIKSKGIDVRVERTGYAVELYNILRNKGSVVAALHLTC